MDQMHTAVAKAKSIPIVSYSPLARSLMTLNSQEKARLMKKFDICYVLAREGIAFFLNTLVFMHWNRSMEWI